MLSLLLLKIVSALDATEATRHLACTDVFGAHTLDRSAAKETQRH
jgi:hypothetical protein